MKIKTLFILLLSFIFSSFTEKIIASETVDNKTVTFTVNYKEERGTIKVNNVELKSGQSLSVEYGSTVSIIITPNDGYCAGFSFFKITPKREVSKVMGYDLTDYNRRPLTFVFENFVEDMIFDFTFVKLYNASVDVRNDEMFLNNTHVLIDGKTILPGKQEIILRYIRDMEIEVMKSADFCLKQILIDDVNMTSEVSENKLKLYDPPKNILVEYAKALSIFTSYNEGGRVELNDQSVPSGQSVTVAASTDVKITIAPHIGYRIQQVKLGGEDVTYLVNDNVLMISSIAEDKEITVVFEKIHNVKVAYSTGGNVKVNNQSVTSGQSVIVKASTEVKVTITPQSGYRIQQVKLGDNDVTNQLSNNILTIPSILSDKEISITFEKGDPITYAVKVTYSTGGSVMVNDQSVTSGQSVTVTTSADAKVTITPHPDHRILQVELGGKDVTDQLSGNQLTISSIFEDEEIKITFVRTTYVLSVTYSEGGYVLVGKNGGGNKKFASGESETFRAFDIVDVRITPETGYRIKQILLGNVDVTDRGDMLLLSYSNSKEVTDQKITVIFEKITYSVKVTYSDGGSIEVNDLSVASGNTFTADIFTDVKVKIIPNKGYRLREVKLGRIDVTDQVKDNILTIPSISENKEITITFTHILKVYSVGNGSIKVNDEIIQSGSIVPDLDTGTKLKFIPDEGYYTAKVTLNSEDITSELIDNSYTIPSLPSNSSLIVTFKTFPTYELNIDMPRNLASIKIDDKVITESTRISDIKKGSSILINFQPSKYYEIKKVTLGDEDITSQIQDGSYEIKSVKSNLTLKVEYVRKQYTLLVNIQGTDKIQINRKEVINGSSIITNSGDNYIDIFSEYYLIKQVLLDDKIVYQDRADVISYSASIEANIDCDKKLTIITELREKREVSLTLEEPGTLASLLSEEDMRLITDLNINGKIDQRDLVVMNQMPSLFNLYMATAIIEKYSIYPANSIPEKVFQNNKSIKILYLPHSIESIGKQAFSGSVIASFLASSESYKYLTKIEEEAFKDCQYLIESPSIYNVPIIEKSVFENCTNLTSILSVLDNVIEIRESAFRNCKNLSIILESGLQRIGDYAFENVKDISIPSWYNEKFELSHIGINAFKGCQNDVFDFKSYPNLKELPCFEGCDKLVSISFPPNIKEIPTGTFKGCTSLQYVEMNENIERIGENAFSDSKFINNLYVLNNEPPEVYENSFSDFVYGSAELIVPTDYLYFYRNHTIWGKFQNIKPWGSETYRNLKAVISEGGEVKVKANDDTFFDEIFYNGGLNWKSFPTSSCVELIILPEEGYLIESVLLNEKNITNALDEKNKFVISNLMVDSHLEVKFKKDNTTTSNERINTNKRIYLSSTNQLSLSGFRIGTHVFVYDASGRLVMQTIVRNQVEKISLPDKGIYFIRIDNESFKIIF